jgi:hypothetical protein
MEFGVCTSPFLICQAATSGPFPENTIPFSHLFIYSVLELNVRQPAPQEKTNNKNYTLLEK